jgi:hypothetical protein
MRLIPESPDLDYWNGRFFLWCLAKRPVWAMSKDLRAWNKQTRPVAQA